ncbi:MAG: pilin [Patescibacteria group bacterium]|nr:pilin [Patescibacteria group bacterium]
MEFFKKFLTLSLIFFYFFVLIYPNRVFSIDSTPAFQDRLATCDQCGYCLNNDPPSDWAKCAACLYEEIFPTLPDNSVALGNQTLIIDDQTGLPPQPKPGRTYTMIGCIKTDLGSFQNEGAAASLVKKLLDIIFSIVGGIALLYFIYGSFLILTSQNEPEKLNYGKRVIYGAIIGLLFTVFSVFIINLLANGVLKIPGFSNTSPTP